MVRSIVDWVAGWDPIPTAKAPIEIGSSLIDHNSKAGGFPAMVDFQLASSASEYDFPGLISSLRKRNQASMLAMIILRD
jgi:hypothetical protein